MGKQDIHVVIRIRGARGYKLIEVPIRSTVNREIFNHQVPCDCSQISCCFTRVVDFESIRR